MAQAIFVYCDVMFVLNDDHMIFVISDTSRDFVYWYMACDFVDNYVNGVM